MPDVFVSYKREDQTRVAPIVQALEKVGLSVWWDRGIPGGEPWRKTIRENLNGAACALVVWSDISVGEAGEFVQEEAGRAKARGVLLPIRIDAVQPPLGFGQIQTLDLVDWAGDAGDGRFQDVVSAVRALISGGPRPVPKATAPRLRRATVVGSGIATAALVLGIFANVKNLFPTVCNLPGVRSVWKAVADTSYKREVQTLPLTVRPTLAGFPSEGVARQDASARARDEAKNACKPFEREGTHLLASDDTVSDWRCSVREGGSVCGFDGQALCTLDVPTVTTGAGCP